MIHDRDLEANARQQLTRLVDQIDVDAPPPVDEPDQTVRRRPTVTVAAGLVLAAAAGVIAVAASDRGSSPAVEVTAPEPSTEASTETILWSSQDASQDEPCLLEDHACSEISLASQDGRLVLLGRESGPGAQAPAAIHVRYGVDGEVDELTIETTPGEVRDGVLEWSAEIPTQVPVFVDPVTGAIGVDFFEFAALDQDGDRPWTIGRYPSDHQTGD